MFIEYLKKSKEDSKNLGKVKRIHVILGNESCDLDSMVSALALAYYYYSKIYKTSETKVLPVLNFKSENFPLRTENVYLLKKNKIDLDLLIFKDQINLKKFHDKKGLEITLVDHHVLSKEDEYLKDSVIEIYDHRPIDKSIRWGSNVDMYIDQVGSCTTIICQQIYKKELKCMCELAELLYATIVFDTVGFKPEANKAKDLDFKMAETLENDLKAVKNRLETFQELWSAHNDVSALTSKQLLLRDLKVLDKRLFVPGLPMLVSKYLIRPDSHDAILKFCNEYEVSVLVLMGLEAGGDVVERDLLLYCKDKNSSLFKSVVENLSKNEELGLMEDPVENDFLYYKQKSSSISRKQIIPILKEAIKQ